MDLAEIQELYDQIMGVWTEFGPYVEWARANWAPIALTAEIVGALSAMALHRYRLGAGWALAALGTIWAGGLP